MKYSDAHTCLAGAVPHLLCYHLGHLNKLAGSERERDQAPLTLQTVKTSQNKFSNRE